MSGIRLRRRIFVVCVLVMAPLLFLGGPLDRNGRFVSKNLTTPTVTRFSITGNRLFFNNNIKLARFPHI